MFFFISMNVNDLLQSLCRPNMFFIWSLWSSMISCKASVAQICFLFDLYDRQWSPTKPRSPKNVYQYSLIWSSMIFYKASVAHICFYLFRMIVNDLVQSLGRLKMYLVLSPRSSMIFYKASVAHICFLFVSYDRQWSRTKPRSPINVSCLVFKIVNDLLQSLERTNMLLFGFSDCQWSKKPWSPKNIFIWSLWSSMISYKASAAKNVSCLISMIVKDLLQSLSRPNMLFIWSLWSLMISYKASVAQKCVSFSIIWSSMIFYKSLDVQICYYLVSLIVNDLLKNLGHPKMFSIWSLWLSMIF